MIADEKLSRYEINSSIYLYIAIYRTKSSMIT